MRLWFTKPLQVWVWSCSWIRWTWQRQTSLYRWTAATKLSTFQSWPQSWWPWNLDGCTTQIPWVIPAITSPSHFPCCSPSLRETCQSVYRITSPKPLTLQINWPNPSANHKYLEVDSFCWNHFGLRSQQSCYSLLAWEKIWASFVLFLVTSWAIMHRTK